MSVWLGVCFYGLDDGAGPLQTTCAYFMVFYPQLQRAANKPLSSNLQTVQQSMGNYLGQSMVLPFCFSLFLPPPAVSSVAPRSHPHPSSPFFFFAISLFFFLPLLHASPSSLTCIPWSSSWLHSTYFEMRQLSSSGTISKSRFFFSFCSQGIFNVSGRSLLAAVCS